MLSSLSLAVFSPSLLTGKKRGCADAVTSPLSGAQWCILTLAVQSNPLFFKVTSTWVFPPVSNRWPARKHLSCCSLLSFSFPMVSPSPLLCTGLFHSPKRMAVSQVGRALSALLILTGHIPAIPATVNLSPPGSPGCCHEQCLEFSLPWPDLSSSSGSHLSHQAVLNSPRKTSGHFLYPGSGSG